MEYSYEIIESLEETYKDDVEHLLLILNELDGNSPSDEKSFSNEIKSICIKNNRCEHCFAPLIKEEHFERRGDDYTYDELITERRCGTCGEEY